MCDVLDRVLSPFSRSAVACATACVSKRCGTRPTSTVFELGRFVVEASAIGLEPGFWPDQISTNLGNGQALQLQRVRDDGSRIYWQGCIEVLVMND